MRFSLALALLTVSTAVSASTINPLFRRQSFPSCSESCIMGADTMGCDPTDNKCMCSKPAFISAVAACFESACSDPKDLEEANAAARALCAAVGITVTSVSSMPETSAEASTSAPEPSTTGSASSVETSASSVASSAASSASSVASSASSAASSAKASSSKPATSSATSAAATSAGASNGNGALTNGASIFALLGAVGAAFIAL